MGIALSFALYALFGAEVGVATLPFAGDGSALVGRTLAHFALTAATVGLWVGLNFGVRETAAFLVPLALVYLLVWLGRWVGWYAEVSAIRERLGLAPGPSLFHWRETLPYVPFAALLCLLCLLYTSSPAAERAPVRIQNSTAGRAQTAISPQSSSAVAEGPEDGGFSPRNLA